MNYKPLTFFTTISVAAHAALFGLGSGPAELPRPHQDAAIEIGLVSLPKIDRDIARDREQAATPSAVPRESAPDSNSSEKPPINPDISTLHPMPDAATGVDTPQIDFSNQDQPAEEPRPPELSSDSVQGSGPTTATRAAPVTSRNQAPRYPTEALRYGWEGEVWLRVDINRSGGVDKIRIDQSSGYPVLDRAAVKTVRKWEFEPARIGSEAIDGSVRIPIRFRIRRS